MINHVIWSRDKCGATAKCEATEIHARSRAWPKVVFPKLFLKGVRERYASTESNPYMLSTLMIDMIEWF